MKEQVKIIDRTKLKLYPIREWLKGYVPEGVYKIEILNIRKSEDSGSGKLVRVKFYFKPEEDEYDGAYFKSRKQRSRKR